MSEPAEFLVKLGEALERRRAALESNELSKLQEELRAFHNGVSVLYDLFIKKGCIAEDPYKDDGRQGDLTVPQDISGGDANKKDVIGQKLAQLDNELDYLVNFFQFSAANFDQDTIKIVFAMMKFVDWGRLTPDSPSKMTVAIEKIVTALRHSGGDPVSLALLNDTILKLGKTTASAATILKSLSEFNREDYKYNLREKVTAALKPVEAQLPIVKKKFAALCPDEHFYSELAEEVLREDYSEKRDILQEDVLKRLAAPAAKPKTAKKEVNYKALMIGALNSLGTSAIAFTEILEKIRANSEVLSSRKKSLWEKIKKLMAQIANKQDEPVVYEIEYFDAAKSATVKEKVNFTFFCNELDKKTKILASMARGGVAATKLEGMEENVLIELLQKNIKDAETYHKTLAALDEYFKKNVEREDRVKIKGIKPDLSAVKNAISSANERYRDYASQKEEAEQFKRLGIDNAGGA